MLLQPALENLRLAAFERQSSGASLSLGLCDIKPKKRGTGVSVVCKFLPKSRFRRGKLPVMERDAPASAAARDGQTDRRTLRAFARGRRRINSAPYFIGTTEPRARRLKANLCPANREDSGSKMRGLELRGGKKKYSNPSKTN